MAEWWLLSRSVILVVLLSDSSLLRKTTELGLMYKLVLLWIVVVTRVSSCIRVERTRVWNFLDIDQKFSWFNSSQVIPLLQSLLTIHDFIPDQAFESHLVSFEVYIVLIGVTGTFYCSFNYWLLVIVFWELFADRTNCLLVQYISCAFDICNGIFVWCLRFAYTDLTDHNLISYAFWLIWRY